MLAAVIVVFLPILAGMAARWLMASPTMLEQASGDLAFRVFAPFLVFVSILHAPRGLSPDMAALAVFFVSALAVAALTFGGEVLIVPQKDGRTGAAVAASYGNTLFFGLPLCAAVL